jgi:hypothetical protein
LPLLSRVRFFSVALLVAVDALFLRIVTLFEFDIWRLSVYPFDLSTSVYTMPILSSSGDRRSSIVHGSAFKLSIAGILAQKDATGKVIGRVFPFRNFVSTVVSY